jgi:hypothetical protein
VRPYLSTSFDDVVAGSVTITGKTAEVLTSGNTVFGPVVIADNVSTGSNGPTVDGNLITGSLSGNGNVPSPTDGGRPNHVLGGRRGQFSDPRF